MKKTRYIPSSYKPLKANSYASVFGTEVPNAGNLRFVAMGFIGESSKHSFHYGYPSREDMESSVDGFLDRVASNKAASEKRRADYKVRLAKDIADVKVGDIFSYSWGYDQTNVDFYQVVQKKPKSFVVREIGHRLEVGEGLSPMAGYVYAQKDLFLSDSKPITKTSFSMRHGILSKTTENEKHYCSWYA